jgi:putative transposase
MVTSPDFRHVPTGTLAVLALAARHGLGLTLNLVPPRPAARLAPPAPPRTSRETQDRASHDTREREWHIDTTVIRLLDGTHAYLHAVIDNFSRRILAWRVADTFAPGNSVSVLLDASRAVAPSDTIPVVLADAGVRT